LTKTILHNSKEKKAFFMLLYTVLHYHDMEESGVKLIKELIAEHNASKEAAWADNFVTKDILSSLDRSKVEVLKLLALSDNNVRLGVLQGVWEGTKSKGYITEIETGLVLGLARNWNIEQDFIEVINAG